MLRLGAARTQKVALSRAARPTARYTRRAIVQVYSKKSRDQEMEEAYQEQLAYLERRREKLAARLAKNKAAGPAASPTAPAAQPAPSKAKKAAEPSIKVAQEAPSKKNGGNPLGFLSGLFGGK